MMQDKNSLIAANPNEIFKLVGSFGSWDDRNANLMFDSDWSKVLLNTNAAASLLTQCWHFVVKLLKYVIKIFFGRS